MLDEQVEVDIIKGSLVIIPVLVASLARFACITKVQQVHVMFCDCLLDLNAFSECMLDLFGPLFFNSHDRLIVIAARSSIYIITETHIII